MAHPKKEVKFSWISSFVLYVLLFTGLSSPEPLLTEVCLRDLRAQGQPDLSGEF